MDQALELHLWWKQLSSGEQRFLTEIAFEYSEEHVLYEVPDRYDDWHRTRSYIALRELIADKLDEYDAAHGGSS